MPGETEKLSIQIATMFKDTGIKAASRAVKGLSSDIESVGDRAGRSASQARTAFASIASAMQKARAEAKTGASFKVSANVSALAGVGRMFQGLRQDAQRGATLCRLGNPSFFAARSVHNSEGVAGNRVAFSRMQPKSAGTPRM